jgi:ribosome-binding factor A
MESKRQRQVSELIKRNFSSVLMEEGIYLYGNALVSVTDVKMSPDLRLAKIYVSIFNADDKDLVYKKLLQNTVSLKQELVKKIRKHVRRIPEIKIFKDDLLDEMYRIDQMLNDLE